MQSILSTALLAACAGIAALAIPMTSEAARVGYTPLYCWGGSPATLITTAGHTAVALNTAYSQLTPAELSGLDGLYVGGCGNTPSNAAVDSALTAGLVVWMDAYHPSTFPGNRPLPMTSAGLGHTYSSIRYPANAAWRNGAGGVVADNALDGVYTFYTFPAQLPPDVTVMATNALDNSVRVISYPVGRGKVVVSTFVTNCFLPGAGCGNPPFAAGLRALTTNLIEWALPTFTSCAAEGFTGPKLTLCRQVCEVDQTSATLTNKIKLYTAIFRQAPPCGL